MRLYFFFLLFVLSSPVFSQKVEDIQSLTVLLAKGLPDTLQLNHHEQTQFTLSAEGVPMFKFEHALNNYVIASLLANNHLFTHGKCYGLYLFVDPITSRRMLNLSEESCEKLFVTSFVNVTVERGFHAFGDSLLKDWSAVIHNTDLFSNGQPKQVDIFVNKSGVATFVGDSLLVQHLHAALKPSWRPGIYYGAPVNNVQTLHVFSLNSLEKDFIQYGKLAFVLSERFDDKFLKFDWNWLGEIDQNKHTAVSFLYDPARGRITEPVIHTDKYGNAKRMINWINANYELIAGDFFSKFSWPSRYLFYTD
ncbi:hypothetical protein [Sphingobacterium griseoflavum]|uniref:Uncharacterized protein n=1 Tax=Sphingobacterium griseoflavum TaxID=1474952 RepID=A0ABQ3HSG1_9SPHI|nr:hypothetical protein [Sphingobacterium griseoflavum]GHE23779.1 hypothetical protein GCM10017764_07470 [Sphingobacterium griseoflavum]